MGSPPYINSISVFIYYHKWTKFMCIWLILTFQFFSLKEQILVSRFKSQGGELFFVPNKCWGLLLSFACRYAMYAQEKFYYKHFTDKAFIIHVCCFEFVVGVALQEFCQYGTKEECQKLNESKEKCERLHFRKIIHKHTDGRNTWLYFFFITTSLFLCSTTCIRIFKYSYHVIWILTCRIPWRLFISKYVFSHGYMQGLFHISLKTFK